MSGNFAAGNAGSITYAHHGTRVEGSHWWFVGRRRAILESFSKKRFVTNYERRATNFAFWMLAAGTGANLEMLGAIRRG